MYNHDEEGEKIEPTENENIQKYILEKQQYNQSRITAHDQRWATDNAGAEVSEEILNLNPVRALGNFKKMIEMAGDEEQQ